MSFRAYETSLSELLEQIARGEVQLPDFQRGWAWDDPHVRYLLASISLSYPIGAIMLLEAGGVPFKPRLFEGVSRSTSPTPRYLILDGQQRLTSMYLALRSGRQPTPFPSANWVPMRSARSCRTALDDS